jgi:AcrR family transcriptional regulator
MKISCEDLRMTGKRSQQRVATRERILATARQLFLTATFEQVGVREIAAEAGVATGTVIAAFGSKGDLLNAIVVEDLHIQLPLMQTAVQLHQSTFDRVAALCETCVAYQANQPAIVRASMADAWTRTDEAENRVRAAYKPIFGFLVQELQRGMARGEVREDLDLKLAASMIFETVLCSYRIPIYQETNMRDLGPILHERLALLFVAFGTQAAQAKQSDSFRQGVAA